MKRRKEGWRREGEEEEEESSQGWSEHVDAEQAEGPNRVCRSVIWGPIVCQSDQSALKSRRNPFYLLRLWQRLFFFSSTFIGSYRWKDDSGAAAVSETLQLLMVCVSLQVKHTHTLTRECVCVCVCLCSFRLIVFVDRMKTGPVWNIQTVFTETNENTAPNTVSLNELWFYTLLNSQCLLFPAVETYDVNMKWCDQPRPGTESQSSLTVTFMLSLFHCSLLRHWLSSNNGVTFLSQRLNFLVFCFYPGIVESILQPVNCFFVCLSWWL